MQLLQHDLARDRLRHFDHGREVEVFDRRPDRARRPGRWLFLPEVRIELIELPHLPIGSPTQVAVAGVAQIHIRDLLEPTRRVEARGEFVGERLVVNKAVGAGRADGLFVEALGLELAALRARDLRADQRGAVLEILRAIRRPDLELLCGARPEPRDAARRSPPPRSRRMRRGTARRKSDILPFRAVTAKSTAAVAPSTRRRWPTA